VAVVDNRVGNLGQVAQNNEPDLDHDLGLGLDHDLDHDLDRDRDLEYHQAFLQCRKKNFTPFLKCTMNLYQNF